MNDIPVGKIYPYASLAVNKIKHANFEAAQDKDGHFEFCSSSALLGIEVEVENVIQCDELNYYWKAKQDGSLRNNGMEYTSIPLRASQVPYALRYLSRCLANNELSFSPRTSIHVHLNVRDMSWDQIKVLTLLYAIFEKHFFYIAGAKRENSIFCVPLYKTDQLRILDTMQHNPKWHKYNAINLATILGDGDVPRFGTVEFRHMYGTLNEHDLCYWIDNILKLRVATQKYKYEDLLQQIKNLNTTSEYIALYQQVFDGYVNLDMMDKNDFESCISNIKLNLFNTYKQPVLPTSNYYKHYSKVEEVKAVTLAKKVLYKTKVEQMDALLNDEPVLVNNDF